MEFNNTAARPGVNHLDDLQVSVAAKCFAIAVIALALYWYNFVFTVPKLVQGTVASAVNLTPTEIVTAGETGIVPNLETVAMASTSIETRE